MRIQLDNPLQLNELSVLLGTQKLKQDARIEYVCTDTRELQSGDLFIGIKGKRYDGSDFTAEAIGIGAYTLTTVTTATFSVKSTNDAIKRIIGYYKKKLSALIKTIAITGSVGKTSTKEILKVICSKKYKTLATANNNNNLIGLLHTVLSAPKDTEILIVEMGMNHKGEIKDMSVAISPDVAIITCIGNAHIGNLGSREQIAIAKLEILKGMKGGDVIIPKDEPLLQQNKIRQTTVSVTDPRADVSLITLSERTGSSYFDAYASGSHIPDLCINSPGKHVLHDLALAIAAAKRLMIPNEAISKAIGSIDKDLFRQKNHVINGYKIYDDSYSSSPEALYAVIDTLLLSGLPIIAVLASQAEGETIVKEASDLRNKEADRITCLVKELRKIGVDIKELPDGFKIQGKCKLKGG